MGKNIFFFLEFDLLHQNLVMYSHKNTSCKVRIASMLKITVRYEKKRSFNRKKNPTRKERTIALNTLS